MIHQKQNIKKNLNENKRALDEQHFELENTFEFVAI
jgi:uncharacterized membrane-anchored protein YhcB (DUF1043 family)